MGNFDAMTNNGRVYRQMPSGKFTWLMYDVEVGADTSDALNRNCFTQNWSGAGLNATGRTEARLLWNLKNSARFSQAFGDRAWQLCFMR